jgi:hypothetical protein
MYRIFHFISLGSKTTNFTSTNDLFLSNPSIEYWRFEVVYSFPIETSLSALNFIINQPPENGSCSINPLNGTTSTLFTISCPNWEDQDGIKDYSFDGMLHFFKRKKLFLILNKRLDNEFSSTNDARFFFSSNNSTSITCWR